MFNVESLERAELGESLLTWIQTFHVEAPCQTVEDLTSGVVMAQVLQKIDPAYFDENWLNRIKREVGDNWRLKYSFAESKGQKLLSTEVFFSLARRCGGKMGASVKLQTPLD